MKNTLLRENTFKHLYNTAYLGSLSVTNKTYTLRNKHKLGKALQVGRKVLLENHPFQDGKSKNCTKCEVDLTLSQKITNVNYEITLDKEENHKKVLHRNHLIKYCPIEEKIVDLTAIYGLTNADKKTFYRGLLTSQIDKLKGPLNKFSFQNPFEHVEYVPLELLSSPSTTDSQVNEPQNSQQKTQTNRFGFS